MALVVIVVIMTITTIMAEIVKMAIIATITTIARIRKNLTYHINYNLIIYAFFSFCIIQIYIST